MDCDLTALTDAQLEQHHQDVLGEARRRRTLATAQAEIARRQAEYLAARDTAPDGAAPPFVAPTGVHDAYPLDYVVTGPDGRLYRSLIPANTATPGDPADPQWWRWWECLNEEPTGPGEWVVGRVYEVDDEVTYDGVRYLVLQAHTSQPDWPPNAVPALYQAIVEED